MSQLETINVFYVTKIFENKFNSPNLTKMSFCHVVVAREQLEVVLSDFKTDLELVPHIMIKDKKDKIGLEGKEKNRIRKEKRKKFFDPYFFFSTYTRVNNYNLFLLYLYFFNISKLHEEQNCRLKYRTVGHFWPFF